MAAGEKTIVSNRRARKDYEILDSYEAGLVLLGTEVKALRSGNANLKDSYAALHGDELWLHNLHIGPYPPAGPNNQHEPERRRKLLLNRREIDRLIGRVIEKGLTLVPLRIYFKNGRAKLELAVARGRKLYDKRDAMRREAVDREIAQALRRRR
jgi:SsrA-binding protein